MKASRLTIEHSLYGLAFLLALGLRTLNLGTTPLSDYEASWALQALELARGEDAVIGANPLYVVITGTLFFLMGDSNAIARLLPALSGSALVLAPLIFKGRFSSTSRLRIAGIILSFGLALDPGLVTVSRLAGGPMPALGLGLLTLGMAYMNRPVLTGFFAGLALLSGPGLLMGILGLALTWGLVRWFDNIEIIDPLMATSQEADIIPGPAAVIKSALRITAVVLLLGGTLFLIAPQGLAGFAATFSTYLGGWLLPSDVPVLRLPASLLVYQPLIVIFGIIGLLRGWARVNRRGWGVRAGSASIHLGCHGARGGNDLPRTAGVRSDLGVGPPLGACLSGICALHSLAGNAHNQLDRSGAGTAGVNIADVGRAELYGTGALQDD
jgi:hypothetical protein